MAYVKTYLQSDSGVDTKLVSTTPVTLTRTDNIVLVNASSGSISITLPAPIEGKVINIKKIDSSSNSVIINTPSGTIDGSATQSILFQYDSLSIASDGTNYFLI